MSKARGLVLQNATAAYLLPYWPHAESAGAGRQGRDILGVPGVAIEVKTAREFKPTVFVRQAQAYAGSDLPVVVYWPDGCGAKSAAFALAITPLGHMTRLLIDAGYGGVGL